LTRGACGARRGDATFIDARQEAVDCYDVIEWAAGLEWSNGRVGMTGVSYLTQIQWQSRRCGLLT